MWRCCSDQLSLISPAGSILPNQIRIKADSKLHIDSKMKESFWIRILLRKIGEIDHALFDLMHSTITTMPCLRPELILKFCLGFCDLKPKGENSRHLMPNIGG
jgi:hypothetical protein